MNASDSELERRLAQLRVLAEPAPLEKQRLFESVRAAIGGNPLSPGLADPSLNRATAAGRGRVDLGSRGAARSSWAWLGGVSSGVLVGLALGFGWGRADSPGLERREPIEVSPSLPPAIGSPNAAVDSDAPKAATGRPPSAASERVRSESTSAAAPARSPAPARRSSRPLRSAPAASRREPTQTVGLGLAEGLELLHLAERALHAAEPALALGLLGDLDRRAEPTLLRQERLTTLALALCQLDRAGEAQATRRELQSEFPGSIYARRLDRSCAAPASPGADP